jgi:formyl-CoA transferase/CoA:oxalate CoA-transferase
VDVSLLDSVAALLTYQAGRFFATGESPARTGNRHMTIAPYDTFDAADGVLVLAVGTDAQWRRFCGAIGPLAASLAADPRYATNAGRVEHYLSLRPAVAGILAVRPLQALVADLRAADVPCGAVRSLAEVFGDPQLAARAMVETVAHPSLGALPVLGIPTKLSATPGRIAAPPPRLGEHTSRLLREALGFTEERMEELARQGVVGLSRNVSGAR